MTAPTGTTFSDGQSSIRGYYRNSAGGQWLGVGPDMYLTGGIRSADGTQMTFTYGPTSGTHTDGQQWRWDLMVDTPATAAAGTSQMSYDLTGTSPENSYRAESSTPTTVVGDVSTTLGAHAVVVTSEADDWFTKGTNGTVTITTQTGSGPTGASVAAGGSLSWTTTLPEGYEAGDLPPRETVDGWTTQ